jgi:hypothetical protein
VEGRQAFCLKLHSTRRRGNGLIRLVAEAIPRQRDRHDRDPLGSDPQE